MRVEILNENLEGQYEDFLLRHENTSFFASLGYRNLLREFLGSEDQYLVAVSGDEIIGALPLFLKEHEKFGKVYNSLPFFGSNGAIIADRMDVKTALLERYRFMLEGDRVVAGTIITSPLETQNSWYGTELSLQLDEYRIGQMTFFPPTPDQLMSIFHHKTRNAIRKGQKSGLEIKWEHGREFLSFLSETHQENARKTGIISKPFSFFDMIPKHFDYGSQYRVYVAYADRQPVAAVLIFYFNKTAEYFTPVTVEGYRELQPMSLLIYEAMCDAVNSGFKYWNWGGTAPGAKGVYDFKKRWGTTDLNYYYFTSIKNEKIKELGKEMLLKEFPNFYILPFKDLKNS